MRIAIDFETYPISEAQGTAPKPVCLSYATNKASGVILAEDVIDFLKLIPLEAELIAHNISFEANVILKHYPEMTDWLFAKLDNGTVWCTLISEQIIDMARSVKNNRYSLADLVKHYLNKDISESKKDVSSWRTRYAELDKIPVHLWPKDAYDYSLSDSLYALEVRDHQSRTHKDSVSASVILGMMADRGFVVRKAYVQERIDELVKLMEPMRNTLINAGVAEYTKKGIFSKKTKVFREYLIDNKQQLLYTDKGQVATNKKALRECSDNIPIIWLEYAHKEKLLNTYFKTIMSADNIVRTGYNAVVETCRTSSRGSKLLPALNMQNMPRSDGVRESFKARDGFMLCSIDYGSLELVCAAQQLYNLYGKSALRDVLNSGDSPIDVHSMLGCKIMSIAEGKEISYEEFTLNKKKAPYKDFRQLAKPINLGYPGGIGVKTMIATAKETYGVVMTGEEAGRLKKLFFDMYPELGKFLNKDVHQLLTGMEIQLGDKRVPEYYYGCKGVKRRGCTYNATCNGFLMQTPAALGTKRMLWRLGQATLKDTDIYPLAFIHDEILLEIRDNERLYDNVEKMAYLMIDSMKEILPDVRVSVEADVGPIWKKEGLGESFTYWR